MSTSPFRYYPDTDTLSIDISSNPATGGGENAGVEGEDQDIIFSFDSLDRLVNITIENASKRADLSQIADRATIVSGKGGGAHSVTSAAETLGVSRHTIHAIIKKMNKAGYSVGSQTKPNASIVLTDQDIEEIKKWRAAHPSGRPVTAER